MDNKERETLREHIVWLGSQLEQERKQNQATVVFLKRVLDPEDLGHAVISRGEATRLPITH
jgi:hypothetical protein